MIDASGARPLAVEKGHDILRCVPLALSIPAFPDMCAYLLRLADYGHAYVPTRVTRGSGYVVVDWLLYVHL